MAYGSGKAPIGNWPMRIHVVCQCGLLHARMHARAYGLYCMRNDSLWGLKCNVGVTLKPAMALLKG